MIKEQITIINKLGLHARAAGKLVSEASAWSSQIKLGNSDKMVDAKSIMSVMMLAAGCGSELILEVDGSDEEEAYRSITALVNDRFGEQE